jgi:hypothetical protein
MCSFAVAPVDAEDVFELAAVEDEDGVEAIGAVADSVMPKPRVRRRCVCIPSVARARTIRERSDDSGGGRPGARCAHVQRRATS